MESILARALKVAEAAEVYLVSSEETSVQFEANRIKHLETGQTTGVALRIIKDGRLGYATATRLDAAEALVANAVETAQFGTRARFQLPGRVDYPGVEVMDADVNAVSIETMAGIGEELVAAITGHTPGILCEGEVSRGVISVKIINSRGGQASYKKTIFGLGVEGNIIDGTDMLFVGDSQSSCHPITTSRNVADSVIRQLELAGNKAGVAGKSMPVVFTPYGVAGAFMPPLMAGFNGKTVLEGASPVGGKMGQHVFDARLCLRDDPTVAWQPGSRPFDDEGVPSQSTPLIEGGVVAGFLYDLQTAALAGARSTGNGNRGRGGQPSPSPSAFVIEPGDTAFHDMIKDMKEGLVVEQLIGAGQGNVLGGDFSGNVLLGYKVENGELVGRVKDTVVAGNVYDVIRQITAIGSDARWVGGFLYSPSLYCPGISVASKG
ncbi:TldD/PmbA family protein [Chloroflexota bacterium]